VGPVLNFAASNFPFAFSVAGGDTAAALAAGCPVVVKAQPGHPRLSVRTAAVVRDALHRAGLPEDTLQLVLGQEAGVALLKDERIAAASFTGSLRAGRVLADIAAARPRPIPFFGELGSVNPVFVTEAALAERSADIAGGFVTSVSGSAGQLCTKPGFLFVPAGHDLAEPIVSAAAAVPEHRLLHPGIASGYAARRAAILGVPGVSVLHEGGLREDGDGHTWVTPTIVATSLDDLLEHRDVLLDEAFGPLSIVVEYDPTGALVETVAGLFAGNLTGTVHAVPGDPWPQLQPLVGWLTAATGRVLFGGWPTGVAVTHAMQHGGPWPATTNDSGTSVGSAALRRFLRPVTYQGAPQELLPPPLQDANPWSVPQERHAEGASAAWGQLGRADAGSQGSGA
jgi:NADP-dependent aldehyde dehydrogenase